MVARLKLKGIDGGAPPGVDFIGLAIVSFFLGRAIQALLLKVVRPEFGAG